MFRVVNVSPYFLILNLPSEGYKRKWELQRTYNGLTTEAYITWK